MSLINKTKHKMSNEKKILKKTYKVLNIKTDEQEKFLNSLIKSDEIMQELFDNLKFLVEAKQKRSKKIARLSVHVVGSLTMLFASSYATLSNLNNWSAVPASEQRFLIISLAASLTAGLIGPNSALKAVSEFSEIKTKIKQLSILGQFKISLAAIIQTFNTENSN